LILTEGEKLVKTPTYHVFDLFKEHQDGELVYCFAENEYVGGKDRIPLISSSASVKDGVMTLTLANCSLEDSAEISCDIRGFECTEASARILTAEVHTYNDFDAPDRLAPAEYPVKLENGVLTAELPACSVVSVTIK
ncbi:MAG: alpha-L-arabinofuranosidase C-terminal domain-containing protein, partial [Huintestinicola sp.]